jgi:hypothetical protein
MQSRSIKEEKEYYRKKIIEMAIESKKTITIETEMVLSCKDYYELGKMISELVNKKIKDCDDHIDYMKNH